MEPFVLTTKLHQPSPLIRGIHRQRLVTRLNQGLLAGRSLTLVSAPAGFGKTTCVSEWIEQLDLPVAWLSLEPADDDPARFFLYFIAALQKINSSLENELKRLLEPGQLFPTQSVFTILLQNIHRFEFRFLLVLDDFQNIQEKTIIEFLEMLVENSPPQLHLVILTREDPLIPLARLRANNQMTEIRAEDLRFSNDETRDFFSKTMGVTLAEEDLRMLDHRIEGWAAGLQLVGLSIYGRENPSQFISNLRGTQRHILSYLTEEVLNHQSIEVQKFLIETSLLDKMCAELCDAVTGRMDSKVLLDHLFSANLFLVPLDDHQQWFRYHHLFADLLRSQLNRISKQRIIQLHNNASKWFEQEGMVAEAIDQALAGEDYDRAVGLLEQHAMSFAMQGYVKTVENWMLAIPPALRSQSPRANLAFSSVYLMRGNYAESAKYLSQAEASIFQNSSADGSDNLELAALQAEWYAIQANLFNVRGNPTESLSAAEKSLQLASSEQFQILCIAYLGMGGAYRLIGNYQKLVEAYQKAIHYSRAAGNLLAEMLSSTALGLVAIQLGQLHFAYQIAIEAVDRYETSNMLPPPVAGSVYGILGLVELEWNQLDRVHNHFLKALQLNSLGGHNAGVVFAKVLMARLAQTQGKLDDATKLMNEAANLLPLGVPAWLKPEVISQQVLIYLAQNNPISAEVVLNQVPGSFLEPEKYPSELIFIAQLRVVLYYVKNGEYKGDLDLPLQLADCLITTAIQNHRLGIALEILMVLIQIQSIVGRKDAALESLSKALQLAEHEGYLRIFLDAGSEIHELLKIAQKKNLHPEITRKLLAAFSSAETISTSSAEQTGLFEPLSDRELEVLKLMSEGLTNPEIADHLIISLSTVKTHLVHIFNKLGVRNRAEAVLKAKEIGIL